MKKPKIIKKGTEKRYFRDTTRNLKGYVVKKLGDTFYITQSTVIFTHSGSVTVANAVWVGYSGLLQTLIYIDEGEIITTGAIVNEIGVEQKVIKINKYI